MSSLPFAAPDDGPNVASFDEPTDRPLPASEPTPGSPLPPPGGLTDRDRDILAFERQWWRHPGSKEQAVSDRFGLSSTRYYQLLNGLIDRPDALAFDPMLVKRLQRVRSARRSARRVR